MIASIYRLIITPFLIYIAYNYYPSFAAFLISKRGRGGKISLPLNVVCYAYSSNFKGDLRERKGGF